MKDAKRQADAPAQDLVLVTGPSGAGRSTAIRALEDVGFEAIDNLPLRLVPRLLREESDHRPLALGIDARGRDFSAAALIELVDRLTRNPAVHLQLLYLDADREVLLRRFSETRRRHPLAPAETPDHGITREFDLLAPVRVRADHLIDTSELSPHDLRAEIQARFAPEDSGKLAISIHSFSYKRGLPRGIDMVFDVRFLRNPYWEPELRGLDGRDPRVAGHVAGDPRFEAFFDKVQGLTELLLPAYKEEGKAHFALGFGCTGGQHRSVAVAERLAMALENNGWQVSIRHREMERTGIAPAPSTDARSETEKAKR